LIRRPTGERLLSAFKNLHVFRGTSEKPQYRENFTTRERIFRRREKESAGREGFRDVASGHSAALTKALERIARQPGFHGVRAQSWTLFEVPRAHGYMARFRQ
jgi:hypothetical protein